MNIQEPRRLAEALRDQGLCDWVAANRNVSEERFMVAGRETTLAHVVVVKCQQASEKLFKGLRLWLSPTFDPTSGHAPLQRQLEERLSREMQALLYSLNRLGNIVEDLKWLESLAPNPPEPEPGQEGRPVPLDRIHINSEYAFWDAASRRLLVAAEGLTYRNHAARALRAVRNLLGALSVSEPAKFTAAIKQFLDDHRFSLNEPPLSSP